MPKPLAPQKSTDIGYLNVAVTSSVPTATVKSKQLESMAAKVCSHLGLSKVELSVHFVGQKKMRTLNRDYRNKDKTTDVLSFSQMYFTRPLMVKKPRADKTISKQKTKQSRSSASKSSILNNLLGDVVISLTDAERNARTAGHTTDQEICLLLVHGILHLCGHDHELLEDEKIMFREQDKLMDLLSGKNTSTKAKPEWLGCVKLRGKT